MTTHRPPPSPAAMDGRQAPHHDSASIGDWSSTIPRHTDWVFRQLRPHLVPPLVEMGAGTGLLSERIARSWQSGVAFVEPYLVPAAGVHARRAWVAGGAECIRSASCRTVVSKCVLEHIRDDESALREWRRILTLGGTLVLWVPACPSLFGALDEQLGHHRRYQAEGLRHLLESTGYQVRESRYRERLAGIGWWLAGRAPRTTGPSTTGLRLYDRLLPLATIWEDWPGARRIPFGAALFVVAEAV